MPLKVQYPLLTIGLELFQLGVHTRAKNKTNCNYDTSLVPLIDSFLDLKSVGSWVDITACYIPIGITLPFKVKLEE